MVPCLEQPIPHVLAHLPAAGSRWMIGMAGVPGSGKSTLAAALAHEINARVGPQTCMALGMDGFHLTKAALRHMPDPAAAFARRGAPWTFNTAALLERLHAVRDAAGHAPVLWPDFQHDVGDPVEGAYVVAPATRVIVVEGLYLLHEDDGWAPIARCFDERWFLDTPMALAMERLTQRHMAAWGYTRAQAHQRIATNDGRNAALVMHSRDHADWRLTSAEIAARAGAP